SAAICLPAVVLAVVVRGAARRGMVGLSAGMATMMAGLVVGVTAVQLDATDATAVGTPGAPIALAVLASVVVGGLATWLAGADAPAPATDAVPADAPRLSLPEGGEAVWTAPLPSIPVVVPIAVIALLLGVTVPVGLLTGDWWTLVFPVLIGALLLVMSGWRVQVDAGGLTLRSGLGWPRYHVPAAEVVRADVTDVKIGRASCRESQCIKMIQTCG